MILIDTLLKFKNLLESASFMAALDERTSIKFNYREERNLKELIEYLTVNNLWTVEDLKKAANKNK